MTRFDQNIHSTVFPNGPAGLYFPGDAGLPDPGRHEHAVEQLRTARRRWPGIRRATARRRSARRTGNRIEFVNAPVPPEHVGRAAVGIGSAAQQPARRSRQPVPQPRRADEHFPRHVRPERDVFAQRAVPEPHQRHGVDARRSVERHRRAAADVDLVCVRRLRRQPDQQHLGIDAAQQRACSRTSARRRRASPTSTSAGRSPCQDPNNGKYYGPVDSMSPMAPSASTACCCRSGRAGRGRRSTPTTRCRTATDRRTAAAAATTNVSAGYNIPDNPRFDRRQLHGGSSAQLLADRQRPVAAVDYSWRCTRVRTGGWSAASGR